MSIEKTLLSKDQLKLTINWGELSGDIHNQYDLINIINKYNITRVETVQSYAYRDHVRPQILGITVDEAKEAYDF